MLELAQDLGTGLDETADVVVGNEELVIALIDRDPRLCRVGIVGEQIPVAQRRGDLVALQLTGRVGEQGARGKGRLVRVGGEVGNRRHRDDTVGADDDDVLDRPAGVLDDVVEHLTDAAHDCIAGLRVTTVALPAVVEVADARVGIDGDEHRDDLVGPRRRVDRAEDLRRVAHRGLEPLGVGDIQGVHTRRDRRHTRRFGCPRRKGRTGHTFGQVDTVGESHPQAIGLSREALQVGGHRDVVGLAADEDAGLHFLVLAGATGGIVSHREVAESAIPGDVERDVIGHVGRVDVVGRVEVEAEVADLVEFRHGIVAQRWRRRPVEGKVIVRITRDIAEANPSLCSVEDRRDRELIEVDVALARDMRQVQQAIVKAEHAGPLAVLDRVGRHHIHGD